MNIGYMKYKKKVWIRYVKYIKTCELDKNLFLKKVKSYVYNAENILKTEWNLFEIVIYIDQTRLIFGRQGKNSQIRDMAVQAGKMVNRDLNNTTLSEKGENSRWKNN